MSWEYTEFHYRLGSGDLTEALNALGEEGWEAYAVYLDGMYKYYHLKRQKPWAAPTNLP